MSNFFHKNIELIVIERFNNNLKEMSRAVGIPYGTLNSIMKGVSPSADKINQIAESLGLSCDWLLRGVGPMMYADVVEKMTESDEKPTQDYVSIPRYDVYCSAGAGALVESERIIEHINFKLEWFIDMGLQRDKAALISVDGDSMAPTLKNGDMVLVDLRERDRVTADAIYVIDHDGTLKVKRLRKTFTGDLMIISDNPSYPHETIRQSDGVPIRVVGRVAWAGVRM
ncbi:MAG: helix-turn-helix transcriptional regulator [Magnetococcales bacterium]|nr:helix-turn-helix transcriptional regulator [Magnetococcales bacterium]